MYRILCQAVAPALSDHIVAAPALDIDTKTLLADVRAGDIRYVLIGTGKKKQRRKFTRSDLEALIECRYRLISSRPAAARFFKR